MKFSVNLGQGSVPNHRLQGYIKTRTFWLYGAPHIISMPGLWEACGGSQFGRWTSFWNAVQIILLPALCYAPSNFNAVLDQLPPLSLTANCAGSTSYSSWLSTLPARLYTTMAKQLPSTSYLQLCMQNSSQRHCPRCGVTCSFPQEQSQLK